MVEVEEEILIRFIEGTSTEDEVTLIQEWRKQSPDNEKRLEDIYITIKAVNVLQFKHSLDQEKSFLEFKDQIKRRKKGITIKKYFSILQKVAAILFFPVLLITLFVLHNNLNEPSLYATISTNPGMTTSFTLSDGTKVWLNTNSKLKYPTKFSGKIREVELDGQAYFEVTRNEKHPFIVKAAHNYNVEVLGTKFGVLAYQSDDEIETTLIKGSVRINLTKDDKTVFSRLLKPCQKAVYNKNDDDNLKISNVNPKYDIAWINGEILFNKHDMQHVIDVLSRQFNVTFCVKDSDVLNSRITGKFTNEQLPQILECLEIASGLDFIEYKTDLSNGQQNKCINVFKH